MTENSNPNQQAQSTSQVEKIDFAKYRTPQLIGRIADLLGMPKVFLITTVIFILLSLLACYLFIQFSDLTYNTASGIFMCIYTIAVGILFGVLLGILRVISLALLNIEAVLKIVFEISVNVAEDYDKIQDGRIKKPTRGELVLQVFDQIISPVLQDAVAKSYGFLGRAIVWAYRRSIHTAIHHITKRFQNDDPAAESPQHPPQDQPQQDHNPEGKSKTAYSDSVKRFVMAANQSVESIARKIRAFTLTPLYFVYFGCFAFALLSVLVVFLLVKP